MAGWPGTFASKRLEQVWRLQLAQDARSGDLLWVRRPADRAGRACTPQAPPPLARSLAGSCCTQSCLTTVFTTIPLRDSFTSGRTSFAATAVAVAANGTDR